MNLTRSKRIREITRFSVEGVNEELTIRFLLFLYNSISISNQFPYNKVLSALLYSPCLIKKMLSEHTKKGISSRLNPEELRQVICFV
jgi:hypothetical protein